MLFLLAMRTFHETLIDVAASSDDPWLDLELCVPFTLAGLVIRFAVLIVVGRLFSW